MKIFFKEMHFLYLTLTQKMKQKHQQCGRKVNVSL